MGFIRDILRKARKRPATQEPGEQAAPVVMLTGRMPDGEEVHVGTLRVGELLPWKGVVWRVAGARSQGIVLVPTGQLTTGAMKKELAVQKLVRSQIRRNIRQPRY